MNEKKTKSFGNKLILNFTLVVFGGFLVVYFAFNSIMDNYIRGEAETELDREITRVVEREQTVDIPIFSFDGNQHFEAVFSTPIRRDRTILNVDTILLDSNGELLLPEPSELQGFDFERIHTLRNFYNDNQNLFKDSEEMMMVAQGDNAYYMRAISFYLVHSFGTMPVSVLMYTDITPAMNLKNSMNSILLGLLGISGATSLGFSIILSSRFKKSINRLAKHAQIIGEGNFTQRIEGFNDAEFNNLAHSMNNMSNMLGSYEKNQKQFFQNASHELRTPLMSIQGYTEGIQLGVFTTEEASHIILEESKKMTELVDDILYLSRLNNKVDAQLILTTVNMKALLMNCVERVKIIAKKANKQVVVDVKQAATISIKTDSDKLERAILNILTNAIRYATDIVEITAGIFDDELKIKITNDGPLIDEKDLPYIFDRFYKGKDGKTGIGLALTQDIVTRLSGRVTAKNLEVGVQFIMTFSHITK